MNTEIKKISTGLKNLDSKLDGGFRPCNLITIAGRSSMGKSAFIYNIASNIAKDLSINIKELYGVVGFFSLASDKDILLISAARSNCNIVSEKYDLHSSIMVSRLIIDTGDFTIERIKRRAEELKEHEGLKILFIDDIQLIQFKGSDELDLCDKFSHITAKLKNLAMELRIPIVISYPIIDNEEKNVTPTLFDFDEADSIANDSDVVMFLHRDNELDSNDNSKNRNKTDLIIAKYRNGLTDKTEMFYIDKLCKFNDLEEK
jgi:replicative DNA helicase